MVNFLIVNQMIRLMTRYATVSAKIPKELKELIKMYKINVSEVIRSSLEREVKRRIIEDVERKLVSLKEILESIPEGELTRLIREDREAL